MVPGFEHGIGLMGDEWRIGMNDGPFPYWTNPSHVYRPGEMVICAIQYACPEELIGFRYENSYLITPDGCEYLSKFPLEIDGNSKPLAFCGPRKTAFSAVSREPIAETLFCTKIG